MNNFRANNFGNSYYDHNKLGYSSVSKQHGISQRSNSSIMFRPWFQLRS